MREHTYYQTSATVLSKLYANSILVVLNSRMKSTRGYQGSREPKSSITMEVSIGIEFSTPKESVE